MTRTIQAILRLFLMRVSVVAFANQFHVHGGLYDARFVVSLPVVKF